VAVIPLGIVTIQKIVKKGGHQALKKFYEDNCHFSAEVNS
jgi:hypothetical protein